MTDAGELRERIAFDKRTASTDGYGNTKGAWAEQCVVAAKRQALRGGETVMAGRLAGKQPFILRIRQSSATRLIETGWRARDTRGGASYNIRSVADPDGTRAWLDLLVEEGVADG